MLRTLHYRAPSPRAKHYWAATRVGDAFHGRFAEAWLEVALRRKAKSTQQLCRRPPPPADSLAEWFKALASGASPSGRGLEPRSCHLRLHRQRR